MALLKDYAPQNVSLNLSFVKDLYVNGEIKARNARKMAIYESGIIKKNLTKLQKTGIKKMSFMPYLLILLRFR